MSLSQTAARGAVAMVLATLLVAIWSAPTRSQPTAHSEAQHRILNSGHLQHEALQALSDPGHAEQLVRKALQELLVAQEWLSGARGAFKDPLAPLNNKRIQRALALLQQVVDVLSATNRGQAGVAAGAERRQPPAVGRPDYAETVHANLVEALRLTNSVIVF